jgi:hypothetical protein
MDERKQSWRPAEFAERHSLSASFIYTEIRAGRLNARKVNTATIITAADEAAWLDTLPPFETHRSKSPRKTGSSLSEEAGSSKSV